MKNSKKLSDLRTHIEAIDTCIVSLINKREKAALKIGIIKQKNGKPVVNKGLENKRIAMAMETARGLKMGYHSQKFIGKLIHKIIVHCRQMEQLQRRKAEGKK